MDHHLFGRKGMSMIKMERVTNLAFLSGFRTRCMLVTSAFAMWWVIITLHISHSPPGSTLLMGPSLDFSTQAAGKDAAAAASLHSLLLSTNPIAENSASGLHHHHHHPDTQLSRALPEEEEEERTFKEEEEEENQMQQELVEDPCAGRYVYVHDLDPRFNEELLRQCKKLNPWVDWCNVVSNGGLGTMVKNNNRSSSSSSEEDVEAGSSSLDLQLELESGAWFETNQFALEMIFHNRMKQYACLTKNSSQAAAIFVPFYAGLELAMNLWGANISVRDEAPAKLVGWLETQSEWKPHYGHDHFMVGGRITWDFRRETDDEGDWGNKLFVLPACLNMTLLVIEASHLHQNDVGIPYPTYFHPSLDSQIHRWQQRMRQASRPWLFSFAGASRTEALGGSIREDIISQCSDSSRCKLLACQNDADNNICLQPHHLMKLFSNSVFCVQPPGDSYTRRSIFDSMLAGCIPVFFHERSAYTQYVWHLPANHSSYSVMIASSGENKANNIEEVLLRIPTEEVEHMRQTVISFIPNLVYANPLAPPLQTSKDAFDIAVQAVIDRVTAWKVQNQQFQGLQKQGTEETAMSMHRRVQRRCN
ncbi:hypothetical protein CY35_17G020300 [Sphagnum magellanicum]|nr:hypothetical protein CY35_17G020300 [Sphagnum magellanicum]